jgi:SAM-dependent methyltransferase
MPLSIAEWHHRFQQQAAWTLAVRQYLFARQGLNTAARILEVGSGTGVITSWLSGYAKARGYGLDISMPALQFAREQGSRAIPCAGDARWLPFQADTFDAVVCHFFLLWVSHPADALMEMARVTRPGGPVIAFAEPDYGGRIDYPPELVELGHLQAEALRSQGADPEMGRKLSSLFHVAGLSEIETGVLGGQWQGLPSKETLQSEWATFESDLAGTVPAQHLRELRQVDEKAWQNGQRVLFVPTFYAAGRKA